MEENKLKGLQVGRNVHYVLPNGIHRPAIITHIWGVELGVIDLTAFPVERDNLPNVWPRTSVLHSDSHEPMTWHFIEYVE